ncbi:MAG: glycolate oxidase subunit GlcE [Burkholderiaceae bacterium]
MSQAIQASETSHAPKALLAGLSESQAAQWVEALAGRLAQAQAQGKSFAIEGHRSKSFYGEPATGEQVPLSTADYVGVVSYDPTELVVVARSGTPIDHLESLLASKGQRLAFEPPRFGGKGTVGGMVATGLSGPGRLSAGACRDFVLGMTVMNAQGELLRYGGTVMKNVAGYDLSRLHTGALGTLGLILDVALKVLPVPAATATVCIACSQSKAIEDSNLWMAQPLPLSATAFEQAEPGAALGRLSLRFSGAKAAVGAAVELFTAQYGAQALVPAAADAFWLSLRDQTHGFFQPEASFPKLSLWRISVPGCTPALASLQDEPRGCVLEWAAGQRWVWSAKPAVQMQQLAQDHGGHATLYRPAQLAPDAKPAPRFTPLSPALHRLHLRLKDELDPQRVFNPGRLYPSL